MHKIVQHPSSSARVVCSFEKIDSLTRSNCLCFKMEQGMSRTDIWKRFEGIGFTTKQVVGTVDKKANCIDITCRSRQNVSDLYEKLSIEKRISNLRLFESDKITVGVHWVPIPFPIDTLKQYLETRHGSLLRHVSKVYKMGFEMGVYHFEMRKDDLNQHFLILRFRG